MGIDAVRHCLSIKGHDHVDRMGGGHLTMLSVKGFFSAASISSLLPFVPVCLSSVSDPCPYPSCLCLPLRTPFPLSLTVSPRGRLLRRQFGIVVKMRLAGNRRPEFYEGFSVSCLAQASATLLSTLSSPGMIAQLCFSI